MEGDEGGTECLRFWFSIPSQSGTNVLEFTQDLDKNGLCYPPNSSAQYGCLTSTTFHLKNLVSQSG